MRTKNVQTIWYWETLREKRDTVKREAEDSTNLIGNDDKQRHGATISGCEHDVQAKTITLKFNRSLLGNDSVIVAPYGPPPAGKNGTAATITTSVRVLINASYWCRNSSISTTVPGAVGPKWCAGVCGSAPAPSGSNCTVPKCRTAIMCNDPGAPCGGSCGGRSVCGADDVVPTTDAQQQHRLGSKPSPARPEPWIELDIKLGAAPGEVVVDLAKLNGSAPLAIRYGWEDDGNPGCCLADSGLHDALYPCPEASCPIKTRREALPANPFMAALVGGKCRCVPPQVCDE